MARRTQVFGLALIVAAMAVIGGCTMAKVSGRGVSPILMNNPSVKVDLIDHIKVSKRITFDYTNSFDASEILASAFKETGADALVNVGFALKVTPSDYLINLCTLGIASAKTLEIEADAVKAPQGLSSLAPEGETLAQSDYLPNLMPALLEQVGGHGSLAAIERVQGEDGTSYRLIGYNLDTLYQVACNVDRAVR